MKNPAIGIVTPVPMALASALGRIWTNTFIVGASTTKVQLDDAFRGKDNCIAVCTSIRHASKCKDFPNVRLVIRDNINKLEKFGVIDIIDAKKKGDGWSVVNRAPEPKAMFRKVAKLLFGLDEVPSPAEANRIDLPAYEDARKMAVEQAMHDYRLEPEIVTSSQIDYAIERCVHEAKEEFRQSVSEVINIAIVKFFRGEIQSKEWSAVCKRLPSYGIGNDTLNEMKRLSRMVRRQVRRAESDLDVFAASSTWTQSMAKRPKKKRKFKVRKLIKKRRNFVVRKLRRRP